MRPTGDVLAIIPARGGSKGIPNKNLAPLGGQPLIQHSIRAALDSGAVHHLVVSTDSPQIAEASRKAGASVPFLRPAELSRDDTPTIPVLLHGVAWARGEGLQPSWVFCLQPTSPLRSAADIQSALALAQDRDADAVVSVTSAHPHPAWSKTIDADGRLRDLVPSLDRVTRRQDLPPAYTLNGAIYLVRTDVLLAHESFYGARTYGLVMPAERSIDIDTPWDMHVAELAMSLARGTGTHA